MGPTRLPGAQIRWCSLMLRLTTRGPPKEHRHGLCGPPQTWTWPSGSGLPSLEDLFPASGNVLILRTKCIHLPSFSVRSDRPQAISRLRSWNPPAGADGTTVSTGTEAPGEGTGRGQGVLWSWPPLKTPGWPPSLGRWQEGPLQVGR